MGKTIFSKIIDRELPADIYYEDDICIAIKDINPEAPVHFLMIPKKVISSLQTLSEEDSKIIGHMLLKIPQIAKEKKISETGYRVLTNIGDDGGQTVDHLHFHILGGEKLGALNG